MGPSSISSMSTLKGCSLCVYDCKSVELRAQKQNGLPTNSLVCTPQSRNTIKMSFEIC